MHELSATGKEWIILPLTKSESIVVKDIEVPGEIVSVIKNRGIDNVAEWLDPSLGFFMPDPMLIPRVYEISSRICQAVYNQENIALYGDYDVDGATSVAQLFRWLVSTGAKRPRIYIPDRMKEGYGPNEGAMDILHEEGIKLIVVQDSGTTALGPLNYARSLGMDVVVIDHHEPREDGVLPNAIVVNPKIQDSVHLNLTYLCTAGLTFLVLVACNKLMREYNWFNKKSIPQPDLRRLLGLVALGTVADVVPLIGLNRAYVKRGLMYVSDNPGLNALMMITDRQDWTSYNCGYVWGPCINAGGRLGDTSQGARLLSSDSEDECSALALALKDMNEERKSVQSKIVDNVYKEIEAMGGPGDSDHVLVIHLPDAHPGVIGIAAGKVKERMDRSAVVIGQGGKGSARAISGYNIGKYFLQATENRLLIKGGGHPAAAGMTIDPDKVDELRDFLNKSSRGLVRTPIKVELEYDVDDMSLSLIKKFSLLAPMGMGNPGVTVLIKNGRISNVQRIKGRHVKCLLKGQKSVITVMLWDGIGTGLGELILCSDGRETNFIGKMKAGFYADREYIEIDPIDLTFRDKILI